MMNSHNKYMLNIKPLSYLSYFIYNFMGIVIFMIFTGFISFFITYDGTNGLILLKAYIWTIIGLFFLLFIKSIIVPLLYIFSIKIENDKIIIKYQKKFREQKIVLLRSLIEIKVAHHKNKNLCLIITDMSDNKINITQCVISKWDNELIQKIYDDLVMVKTGNGIGHISNKTTIKRF